MSVFSQDPARPGRHAGLSALNAGAVIVAGLYFGQAVLVPLVLAGLLAFVLAPAVVLLQRARLGKAPAVLLTVVLAFAALAGVGVVVGTQASALASDLPRYQATIQEKMKSLAMGGELVERLNSSVQGLLSGAPGARPAPEPAPRAAAPAGDAPESALAIIRTVAAPLFGPLATVGVVAIFVIFILLAREDLRDRTVRLVGRRDLHRTILAMNDAARRLSRYFLLQLALNTGFGAFIAAGLGVAGLPNPVLWGILAALMRFVPFIGSFIAVVPPLLLALAVSPGWSLAVIVLLLFVLSDLLAGQVLEPLLYGHSTGLSPIAVILSTVFWAFLWGPVGLLIATPLTVCLVVVGRYVEHLSFLEVMLGDAPPLEPAETFYQRALEGNAGELLAQARRATNLAEYYDRTAMRGLALAQADLARDALAFERLDAIHQLIESLLTSLAPGSAGHRASVLPPPPWRQDGAIVCIPGRGQLDDLAATMAVQVLQGAGFGALRASHAILDAARVEEAPSTDVRLCCLSVLDQGSSPAGIRYLLRRIQRKMPGSAVVICLWHAAGDSALLSTLRSEGGEEMIVLSLGELDALVKAVSARRAETQDDGVVSSDTGRA